MPILCSIEPQDTSLRPSDPVLVDEGTWGTRNNDRPLVPLSGAPSILASTRWTMFSARSWSPAEMKILVPLIA